MTLFGHYIEFQKYIYFLIFEDFFFSKEFVFTRFCDK